MSENCRYGRGLPGAVSVEKTNKKAPKGRTPEMTVTAPQPFTVIPMRGLGWTQAPRAVVHMQYALRLIM
jgi:hypothetical protein